MKVLWICRFTNARVREKLDLSPRFWETVLRSLFNKPLPERDDYGAWITNAIEEFEKFEGLELHLVVPHTGMAKRMAYFQMEGIHYHFFKPDDDALWRRVRKLFTSSVQSRHKGNRKAIRKVVEEVQPDLIHMYGAENPPYSLAALDLDTERFPLMVSLQTLLNRPGFRDNYLISAQNFRFRAGVEQEILKRAKYIGATPAATRNYVWAELNPQALFFPSFLALEQKVERCACDKRYDFVFFAVSIEKLGDVAVEAFALACKKHPRLTLNIVGGTPEPFTGRLKERIRELGLEKQVIFSGKLPEHKDVLRQIQFSKFALLPLKVDLISGTIREAIYAGLPVVTMKTHGTPLLNEKRRSVLISEQNDLQGLADNMCRLLESPALVKELRENALITLKERYSNARSMQQLIEVYRAIMAHHSKQTPLPPEMGAQNPNI